METSTVDREQLWQLVRGQLSAEETAAACTLVSSDPAVARAYVEVKLEHEQQCRCDAVAAATACETRPAAAPPCAVTTAEAPAANAAATVSETLAPMSVGRAIIYFAIALVLGFALMGLMVTAWSRV